MPFAAGSTSEQPSLALHEFEAIEFLHSGACYGCLAEAEQASVVARVTGSSGATHRSQARSLTGEITEEHFATVQRRTLPQVAPGEPTPIWSDLFAEGKSGIFDL